MYAIAIALCVLALSGSSAYAQNQPAPVAPAAPARRFGEKLDRIRKELAVPADKTSASGSRASSKSSGWLLRSCCGTRR